ncbi:MAG TPA: aminotransferase class V-fold PLP-dependent enzyme [Thermoleophilaceae bacterium]|nr:aminotransferase class V-fold PLP-dependent enzyme [Thermoleophilaceae bacterium]
MDDLDAAVADLAARFRTALEPPSRAGADLDAGALRARFDEPLPERGMPVERVLGELAERCDGGLVGSTGGRFFGFVTGAALPAAAIAEAWAAAVDQNPGLWSLGPAGVEVERVVLHWLADLLDYPGTSGYLTSGATMANLVGLAVARHWAGRRHGVDVRDGGVWGLPRLGVYGSEELHLSDYKALRTLGFGAACVRPIPIDDRYAMRVEPLREAIERDRAQGDFEPAIVIAQAGSVNTGASDPLEAIADVCDEHGLWLHVDGAFGAFFRLYERTAPLVAGIERADSLACDAHKWLNVPNGCGFVLVRDAELHAETFAGTAAYLTPGAGRDLHELGPEASRSWRGACVWAALKQLGRRGMEDLVSRCCDLAAELARLVEESPRLELCAPAPTNVVCFRYRRSGMPEGRDLDELNERIQARVAAEGEVFHTGARLAPGFCQRAAIVSWRTTSDDVAALAGAVERAGDELG